MKKILFAFMIIVASFYIDVSPAFEITDTRVNMCCKPNRRQGMGLTSTGKWKGLPLFIEFEQADPNYFFEKVKFVRRTLNDSELDIKDYEKN
jgi:hypothetical protein